VEGENHESEEPGKCSMEREVARGEGRDLPSTLIRKKRRHAYMVTNLGKSVLRGEGDQTQREEGKTSFLRLSAGNRSEPGPKGRDIHKEKESVFRPPGLTSPVERSRKKWWKSAGNERVWIPNSKEKGGAGKVDTKCNRYPTTKNQPPHSWKYLGAKVGSVSTDEGQNAKRCRRNRSRSGCDHQGGSRQR